jgi:hypothetical protein
VPLGPISRKQFLSLSTILAGALGGRRVVPASSPTWSS